MFGDLKYVAVHQLYFDLIGHIELLYLVWNQKPGRLKTEDFIVNFWEFFKYLIELATLTFES
jgi:hypothetical protein